MTGGQRTFTHIPTSLVRSNGQQRPMTSKAAKKAYQQANRGPRISRAEQHRRDKAELEQQKREYEREKAAERAKAAREKKAAKAAAEKEARRKQGIPEPSKFVRPSQPTISRFVRSNGTSKRTWQQMESVAEDSDKTISDVEKDDEGPPAKRRASDEGSDNEFGDFPSLSQSDLLEQIDSSIISAKDSTSAPRSPKKKPPSSQCHRREASQELPILKEVDEHSILDTQALDELATTQLFSDLAEAVAKSDAMEPPNMRHSQVGEGTSRVPKDLVSPRRSGRVAERGERTVDVSGRRNRDTVPVVEIPYKSAEAILSQAESSPRNNRPKAQALAPVPSFQSRSVTMPPPRLPIKATAATKSISTPQRPSFPSRSPLNHVPKPAKTLPPASTQAFLENHMDDFFPSPTQAVRELLEDVDDIPSNTQVFRELSPKKAEENLFENMFCTQDLIMSPEDLVEIISSDRSPPRPLAEATSESLNRRDNACVGSQLDPKKSDRYFIADTFRSRDLNISPEGLVAVVSPHTTPHRDLVKVTANSPNGWVRTHVNGALCSERTKNDDFDDCIGTQDLILSPEDLEEICSPVRAPSPARAKPAISPPLPPRPAYRQKQRFFQEKEEDLFHAALHESKATSAQRSNIQTNDQASLGRNQSDSTDYGEFDDLPRLFKEKEDEELEAAIRESKITAELEAKRLAMAGMPGLNRIHSNSTDYGDFDLPRLFDEYDEDESNGQAEVKAQTPRQTDEMTANNTRAKPRRFFEEKYEDLEYAAIHESKMLAGEKVPLKQDMSTGTEKPRRTLKRVLSTATDYGDDDFMGCSQELLDLC
ncbi:hypothetical protein BKA64DRAFT_50693 [Cadophora sp. MPI-SDFR-AT-0126]|nr:hypothetical protein BKA64DRAFT_50693 [Leotiomycetes sp. MPI-SDFR-AT-0126]